MHVAPVTTTGFETGRRRLTAAVATAMAVLMALVIPATSSGGGQRSVIVWGSDSAAAAAAAVEATGGTVERTLDLVGGVAAQVDEGAEALLEATGFQVSDDEAVHLQADEPPQAASAVYPSVIGADNVWNQGHDGSGVTVALIDTGINPVDDLSGRVVAGADFSGEGNALADTYGHGTFVAGLIAGNGAASSGAYKGVAPGADLVSVKIAGRTGAADISHVLAAVQWVVSFRDQHSIDVVNLSLGTDSTQSHEVSPLNYAVERAWDAGIVVVTAAANRGPGAGTISKPGDDPWVITAGSVNDHGTASRKDDTVPDFSSRGPTATGVDKPDLVAPGRSVISLRAVGSTIDEVYPDSRIDTGYFRGSGTSFSAAITAGSAALLLDSEPNLEPDQVKARLLESAAAGPVGSVHVDGWGSLDVRSAVEDQGNPKRHNQGNPRSTGMGSYEADRGNLATEIVTDWRLEPALGRLGAIINWTLQPVLTTLEGSLTAQGKTFDQVEFVGSQWHGSQWHGSQWHETVWEGSQWHGSQWHGSQWHGSQWHGSQWHGSQWH